MREVSLLGSRGLILRTLVPEARRERMRGLLGHASLGATDALLLEWTRSIHTFGMRFPVRVAALDSRFVVRSVRDLPPGRLVLPRPGVRHVLECAANADLRPGDRLQLLEAY